MSPTGDNTISPGCFRLREIASRTAGEDALLGAMPDAADAKSSATPLSGFAAAVGALAA